MRFPFSCCCFILLTVFACSEPAETYDGEFQDGQRHGWGTLSTESGTYTGQFKNGAISGIGRYQGDDGNSYVGQWSDRQWHGIGEAIWIGGDWDGDRCMGQFRNHKINGLVRYTFHDGSEHIGYYKDGGAHGVGIRRWKNNTWDGDYYIGEWKNGEMNGFGKYSDKSSGVSRGGTFTPDGSVSGPAFTAEDSTRIMTELLAELARVEAELGRIKAKLR